MKLVIEGDEGRKSAVPLREEMTIGRDEGNTVRLPDRNVSRRHARLFQENGRLLVEDLGSFNGVRVNGRKIGAPTAVKEGDLIEVGDYDLSLQGKLEGRVPESVPVAHPVSHPGRTNGATAIVRAPDVAVSPQVALRDLDRSEMPRLFGLSGPVRGKELYLTRTEVKFGRGSENDAVLDHQSVSRAHARFLLDGGQWKVVDNQSANGIRINGEEYAVGNVGAGDIVELGHLKFRFCGPQEKFALPAGSASDERAAVLGSDEPDAPDAHRHSGLRVAALALVMLTALAGASWLFGRRGRASYRESAHVAAPAAVAEPAPIEPRQPAPAEAAPRGAPNPTPKTRAPTSAAAANTSASAAPATNENNEAQATRLATASNEKLNAHDFEGAVSDAQAALELAPQARDTLCTAYHTLGYGFSYLKDDLSARKYLEQFKPCCASFGETACAQVEEFLAR